VECDHAWVSLSHEKCAYILRISSLTKAFNGGIIQEQEDKQGGNRGDKSWVQARGACLAHLGSKS